MTKKPLCILTAMPYKPSDHHKVVFQDSNLCDYYFVTYKQYNSHALGQFRGEVYYNRNRLAELVPKEYEYYAFIDDDSAFTTTTDKPVVSQLITDLEECRPAVMTTYCAFQGNPSHRDLDPSKYTCGNFSVNMVKIFHWSVLPLFFPTPEQFGCSWDACSFVNILEATCFEQHSVVTPFVRCSTYRSIAGEQRLSPQRQFQNMEENYQWIKKAFKATIPNLPNINAFKQYFLDRRASIDIIKEGKDINYLDWDKIGQYFDLNHEFFREKVK